MKREVAECLIGWEDHPDVDKYEEVTSVRIEDTSRWHIWYSEVYRHVENGTYWEITWKRGATEMQDEGPEDIEVREVKAVEKTVIVYE